MFVLRRTADSTSAVPAIWLWAVLVVLTLLLLRADVRFALGAWATVAIATGIQWLVNRPRLESSRPRPEEDGNAAVPALVGAGPRGPRFARDAKSWPEV